MPQTAVLNDVLTHPEIVRRTQKILALEKKGKTLVKQLGNLYADIGDELIAVKKKLDQGNDKTAWLRWLKTHVHYTSKTAERYMSLAEWRQKNSTSMSNFLHLPVTCLYHLAALPDEHRKKIRPNTKLPVPGTNGSKPVEDMSARELDRALDHLEGRSTGNGNGEKFIDTGTRVGAGVQVGGTTKEAFASAAREAIVSLTGQVTRPRILPLAGKLSPSSKKGVLQVVEELRRAILKWPAVAVPAKKKAD